VVVAITIERNAVIIKMMAAPGTPRYRLDNQRLHGFIYLAAAGILVGREATTHWAWADQQERHGARYTEQRVVQRGKVITAAGVSSGIGWRGAGSRLAGSRLWSGTQGAAPPRGPRAAGRTRRLGRRSRPGYAAEPR
jgi:DJ-1/PfpI family